MTDTLAVIIAEMREDARRSHDVRRDPNYWADRLAAIAPGEAVAWLYEREHSGGVLVRDRWPKYHKGIWTETPLYAAPPPAARSTEPCAWDERSVSDHLDGMAVSRGLWDGVETRSFKRDALLRYIKRLVTAPPAPKGEGCSLCGSEVVSFGICYACAHKAAPPEPARQEKGE